VRPGSGPYRGPDLRPGARWAAV